ncbi:MAG: hypothetical protein NTW96_27345 [Planctomycetia bacterium]|nr:hypothetical protein [Planctomycetia bacterium]
MVKEIYQFAAILDEPFWGMRLVDDIDDAAKDLLYTQFCHVEDHVYVPISLATNWRPPRVEIIHETYNDLPSDYPYFATPTYNHLPAFSRRAIDVLGDLIAGDGEILPVECDEGEFFVYNITRIIDLLDEERSAIDWMKDIDRTGPRPRLKPYAIATIRHFEIHKERLGDAAIFRLPRDPFREYVTDVFHDRVEEAGLQGMEFKKVWPPLRPEKPRLPDWFFKT